MIVDEYNGIERWSTSFIFWSILSQESDVGQPFIGRRRLRQKLPWHEDGSNPNGNAEGNNEVEVIEDEKALDYADQPRKKSPPHDPNGPGEMGLPVKLTNLTAAEKAKVINKSHSHAIN